MQQQNDGNIWSSWFNQAKELAGKAQELAETAGKIAQEKALLLLSKLRKFGRTTIWRFDHAFHACSKHLLYQNFLMVDPFALLIFYDTITKSVEKRTTFRLE